MRLSYALPVAAFSALAAVFGFYLYQIGLDGKNIRDIPSALIDKPAPEFRLPPIDGRDDGFSTADLAGQVSLVNVFASWCFPCRVEHPILMRLAAEGVPIYGINIKDQPEDALRFLDELGNPYRRIGADADGRVSIDWGVYGYPETFIVDRSGRVRYKHIGPIMPRDLKRMIRPVLESLGLESLGS
jgi:cytochrome c biogenesis protein CcmG/thiol:disulfide interchange protein DsbE